MQAVVDQLQLRMGDDLASPVQQIHIAAFSQRAPLYQTAEAGVGNVHEHHALFQPVFLLIKGGASQTDDECALAGENVLHKGTGKIGRGAAPGQRLLKPLAGGNLVRIQRYVACAHRAQQRPVPVKQRDGNNIGIAFFDHLHLLHPSRRPAVHAVRQHGSGEIQGGEQSVNEHVGGADRLEYRLLCPLEGVFFQKRRQRGHQADGNKRQQRAHARHKGCR